jgi:hypothetical protein
LPGFGGGPNKLRLIKKDMSMRRLLLSLAMLGAMLGLPSLHANAATVPGLRPAGSLVVQADYNWHHHQWHHRRWEHHHWHYYD